MEKNHVADAGEDPSRCFKFCVEERIMCSVTKKVKYTRKTDNILSLNIPLRAAVNKGAQLFSSHLDLYFVHLSYLAR